MGECCRKQNTIDERKRSVERMKINLLWGNISKALQTTPERKKRCIESSPIFQAFAKHQKKL